MKKALITVFGLLVATSSFANTDNKFSIINATTNTPISFMWYGSDGQKECDEFIIQPNRQLSIPVEDNDPVAFIGVFDAPNCQGAEIVKPKFEAGVSVTCEDNQGAIACEVGRNNS